MNKQDESGLTLVELIVSIAILGIIMAAVSAALINGLLATSVASQRTTNSNDAQILSDYFINDVQSAATVTTSASCPTPGATAILSLAWTEHVANRPQPPTSTPRAVTYGTASTDGELQLVRFACSGAIGTSRNVVGRSLAGPPILTCDGVSCPSSAGTARQVRIEVTGAGNGRGSAPYTFELAAERRSAP